MVRLTLGGSSLEGFPFGYEGGYLKIVVEDAEGKEGAEDVENCSGQQGAVDNDWKCQQLQKMQNS